MKQTNNSKFLDSNNIVSIDLELRKMYDATGAQTLDWTSVSSVPSFGTARCVYLVQDTTDQTKLGGTANRVYTTFQTAYDAANALQVALGGTNIVDLVVGNMITNQVANTITPAGGDLTLSANFNARVRIVGASPIVSTLGNIIANGFTIGAGSAVATFSNVSIGNITTSQAGASGNGGSISLRLNNAKIGNIDTSITNAANTTGNGGGVGITTTVQLGSIAQVGSIVTSSKATTTTAGGLSLTGGNITVGAVTLSNNNLAGFLQISGLNNSISSFSSTVTDSTGGTQTISNCSFGAFTSSIFGDTFPGDPIWKFQNCSFAAVTITQNASSANHVYVIFNNCFLQNFVGGSDFLTTVYAYNTTFWVREGAGAGICPIQNLGDDSALLSCVLSKEHQFTVPVINNLGTGCKIENSSLRGGSASISSTSGVTVKSNNSIFEKGNIHVTIEKDGGVVNLPDDGAGNFLFDASSYRHAIVILNGSAGGPNTLAISNISIGETYTVLINNATGADTVTIADSNGLYSSYVESTGSLTPGGGGVYTPTNEVGSIDRLLITFDGANIYTAAAGKNFIA